MLQGVAIEKFHGDKRAGIVLANVVDGANVRMIERRVGLGLALEARQSLRILSDKDRAFEWLEKASQEKSDEMVSLRIRRCYDFTRSDPGYKDLERRVGYTW